MSSVVAVLTIRPCAQCGADFEAKTARAKFCGSVCRYRSKDLARGFPCASCGEPMQGGKGVIEGVSVHQKCRPVVHGVARYDRHGCRCDVCRLAKNASIVEFTRRYRERTGETYRNKFANNYHRAWIEPEARLAIYERDDWTCQLCGEPVDPELDGRTDPMAATLDHIECVSWSVVPDHSPANLRLAHRSCNSSRGARADFELVG